MNRPRSPGDSWISLGVLLVALLVLALSHLAPTRAQGGGGAAPPPPASTDMPPAAGLASQEKLAPPKLDSALAALAEGPGAARAAGEVLAEVTVGPGGHDAARAAIVAAGGEVTIVGRGGELLQARLPVAALAPLAARADILMIRRPQQLRPARAAPASGAIVGEGLEPSGAPAWHGAGFTGAGVRVGVISTDFAGYAELLGAELPPAERVVYRDFVDPLAEPQEGPFGTAIGEVIYDMAPGASLYLARVGTALEFEQAAAWLADEGVAVIASGLIAYNDGPGDGTGFHADVIARARASGILWVTDAGNERERHWGGIALDRDGDGWLGVNGLTEINWISEPLPAGVPVELYLRWSDWEQVDQDLDLYALRWDGVMWEVVAESRDFQSGQAGQRPTESVAFLTSGADTYYGLVVRRYSGDRPVNVDLFSYDNPALAERVGARSLPNIADAPAALTVGAIAVDPPFPHEPWSGEGPTNGPGGELSGGLVKPDMAAFSGVSTATYGERAFSTTSASSAYVAGAAALVAGAFPEAGPAELQEFLEGRAIDRGRFGRDTLFGAGQLYLGQAPVEAARFDFDANGHSDFLWRSDGRGLSRVALLAEAGVADIATLPPAGNVGERAVGVGDLSGDGRADAIWLDEGSRRLTIYVTPADEPSLDVILRPFWRVAAVADFNADGVDDILFRHTRDGYNVLLLMRDGEVLHGAGVRWHAPRWQVVASGDFNGDGAADLIWRNSESGRYQRWLMDGREVISRERLARRPSGGGWRLVGAADFDGDGTDDLLWRNEGSGSRRGWVRVALMRDGQPQPSENLIRVSDASWRIANTGDYNADGRADLLWRNLDSGGVTVLLLDGASILAERPFRGASLGWALVGPGTYDGQPALGAASAPRAGHAPSQSADPGDPSAPIGTPPGDPDPGPPPGETDEPDTAPIDVDPAPPADDLTLPGVTDVDEATRRTLRGILDQAGTTIYLPMLVH